MNVPVHIAGVGVISAIGNNTPDCLHALIKGDAGMRTATWLKTAHAGEIPVAEVKVGNDELARLAGMPPTTSRTALLSLLAAREALQHAGIGNLAGLKAGFISANTVGGIDKTETFFQHHFKEERSGALRDIVNHECGRITELVAHKLQLNHYTTTISTACSSSANAIMLAARLIKAGMLDVAVAGGVDALSKFTLNGFNSLLILDTAWCKPFDEHRNGLNLGEGAGYLVLVSGTVAAGLKQPPICGLTGYANANDAYHQTASSPDGTGSYLAMQQALQKAGLQPADIDYINLHGTGTHNNDLAEGTAIERLFRAPYPKMSSTKSFTGHTLGASGGVEAVFSALAIRHGLIYPNLRLETPIEGFPFAAETSLLTEQRVNHVLSNSFGFGGNCTSLIFSKL